MPAERRVGMDHDLYAWSPLPTRPPLRWPGGAPVAVAVAVLVEHVELAPPEGSVQVNLPGGCNGSMFPFPNLPLLAHREYGHRVGIFRVLDALARHGVPPTVVIDAESAERDPTVVERCLAAGAEIVAHGISASRLVTSAMSADEERAYITSSRDRIEAATGQRPRGWWGPEQSESERTPLLLEEAGFTYLCDFPNDEQPYRMATPGGLVSVPSTYLLDDASAVWFRNAPPRAYADLALRGFRTLARDGERSGRSLVLAVRPWMIGQPYRIAAFESLLESIAGSGAAWCARTGELADTVR